MVNYLSLIGKYHQSHNSEYIYFGAPKENFLGVGLEIEIDTNKDIDEAIFQNKCAEILLNEENRHHYFIEYDNSLNKGIELITQPHTILEMYKFIHNSLPSIFEKLKSIGAERTSKSAIHIHFSKKLFGDNLNQQIDNIAKLLYLFSIYKEEFFKIGKKLNSKCKIVKFNNKEEAINYSRYYLTNNKFERIERYVSINLSNKNTIEFRNISTKFNIDYIITQLTLYLYLTIRSKYIDWEYIDNVQEWFKKSPNRVKKYIEQNKMFKGINLN